MYSIINNNWISIVGCILLTKNGSTNLALLEKKILTRRRINLFDIYLWFIWIIKGDQMFSKLSQCCYLLIHLGVVSKCWWFFMKWNKIFHYSLIFICMCISQFILTISFIVTDNSLIIYSIYHIFLNELF